MYTQNYFKIEVLNALIQYKKEEIALAQKEIKKLRVELRKTKNRIKNGEIHN